ncbi:MFS transporter [Cellulomonas dongxiuzhuiae]|uniref:MFS transporter n=1 Tax=Cellulomonas dongxiuzhuiae TaxID=2819979 RepID=A0ABX8GJ04_9CELL|nr:MFS transporter [Cellulomonas dongxiuzhuiae]MBO3095175.1 MFS transporter [Cellulomonas dongxiuzhuiae]QWC16178.1 MFS transporter [Cellulomonas dongxiuzhuiae]
MVTLFTITGIGFMRTPLLPGMGADLELSASSIGFITAVFALGRVLTNVPAGRLADSRPVAQLVGLAAAVMAIGALGVALTASYPVLLVCVALMGVSSALMSTTAMTTLTRRAAPGRRGAAMALYSTSLMTGQMIGPALAGLAAGALSWRATHSISAALALLLGVTVALVAWKVAGPLVARPGAPGARRTSDVDATRPDMTKVELAVVSGVAFAVFFGMGALPFTLLPLFAEDELGLSVELIGLGVGLGGLTRIVGANVCGFIADRVSRKAALVPSMALLGVSALVVALPLTVPLWFVVTAVFSLASSGVAIAGTVIGDRSRPGALGRRMGVYRATGDLGLFVGPLVGTVVYEHVGRSAAAVVVGVFLLVATAVATAALRESRPAAESVAA